MEELEDYVRRDMEASAAAAAAADKETGTLSEEQAIALAQQLRQMIKDGMSDECSICLSEFNQPVITPCAHVYCRPCITQHIESVPTPPAQCPLCRGSISVKKLLEAAQEEPEDDAEDPASSSSKPGKGDKEGFEDIEIEVSSTKLNAVLKELEIGRKKGLGGKTIIVSQFTRLLSIVQPLLDERGFSWTRLDGTMTTRDRTCVVQAFQDESPGTPEILLLSLRAGTHPACDGIE